MDASGGAAKNTLGAATTVAPDVLSLPMKEVIEFLFSLYLVRFLYHQQTSIDEIIVRFKALSKKYQMLLEKDERREVGKTYGGSKVTCQFSPVLQSKELFKYWIFVLLIHFSQFFLQFAVIREYLEIFNTGSR